MPRIAKTDVNRALEMAANRIKDAGGADGRVSRAEITTALKGLTGTEKKLTDVFFKFIDHRDFKTGAQVTSKDVDRAVKYAKTTMIAKYDLDNNGLSPSEVKKMSLTGKLAVTLAKELKAAAAKSTALDAGTFNDFLDQVTTTSRADVTSASTVDSLLTKQLIAACHQSSYTDVKTLADAFEAVDQGEFVVRQVKDKKTGETYTAVDYGAGDNTYGAIFKTGSSKPVVGIHDGDLQVL
ncbi:MAG: hypothetical protein JNM69_38470 [Archangium sp.]|nr:hypothetical protein [Archangium sp.]MBM4779658.1 hypothetical protein [Archangiaceae bacterium]